MRILLRGCRNCSVGELQRVPRSLWMRLLPGLRHYHCEKCGNLLAAKRFVEERQSRERIARTLEPLPRIDRPI